MFKKSLLLITLAVCLLLSACSSANELGLKLAEDGKGEKNYIYFDDERVVYVIGGIMMAETEEQSAMLDVALYDGDITVSDILSTAETDASDGDIEITEYPDGSIEYHYDSFDLIVLNTTDGIHDIYFVPTSMSYYDVIN